MGGEAPPPADPCPRGGAGVRAGDFSTHGAVTPATLWWPLRESGKNGAFQTGIELTASTTVLGIGSCYVGDALVGDDGVKERESVESLPPLRQRDPLLIP